MSGIVNKACRDLTKRRLRSFLTLAGIVIGVAGVVAIVSTSRNMTLAQSKAYANASQADMVITTRDAPESLRSRLLDITNIAEVELRSTYRTKWAVGSSWLDLLLVGIPDFTDIKVNKIDLKSGSFPSKGTVTLESSALEVNPVRIGEEIVYKRSSSGSEKNQLLRVTGLATSPSYPSATVMNTSVAYADIGDVRRAAASHGDNQILIKLADLRQQDETRRAIRDLMAKRNLPIFGESVRDPDNYPGKRELDSLMLLMLIFSGVGLATSGFLVSNTLSAIIGEQVAEIGAMKAFGATREQVLTVYLLLGGMYGIVGTAVGIVAGMSGGWALQQYLGKLLNVEVAFDLDPLALGLGVAVGMGVTVLSALVPAWFGTSLSVKAALDSHGISSTYGQGTADRLIARVTVLPPLLALSIRNLSRRKLRTCVTIGVIAFSSAAFLAAWSTDASVQTTIDDLYTIYGTDGTIWFQEPVGQGFSRSVRAVDGVAIAEPWVFMSGMVKSTRVRLRGIPADTAIYTKTLFNGRWYEEAERDGLVVSSEFARRADVRVGDVVEVEVGTKSAKFRVVGVAKDSSTSVASTSAGNVFLPTDVLSELSGRGGTASFFAIKMADSQGEYVASVLAALEKRFRSLNPGTYSTDVERENNRKLTRILSAMLFGMVIIISAIGAIGVLNTLTLNVMDRRREIGIMRSLGATDDKLVQVFLAEGLAMGIIGSTTGLILGYPLSRYIVATLSQVLFELDFALDPLGVAAMMVFAILLSGIASLGPALGAAHMTTSHALRYE